MTDPASPSDPPGLAELRALVLSDDFAAAVHATVADGGRVDVHIAQVSGPWRAATNGARAALAVAMLWAGWAAPWPNAAFPWFALAFYELERPTPWSVVGAAVSALLGAMALA